MGEKIKVEELGCFEQVAKVIGVGRAKVELFKAISSMERESMWNLSSSIISNTFNWSDTPQGYDFWFDIDCKLHRLQIG